MNILAIIADIAVIITPIVVGAGFYFAYRHWKADERQSEVLSNARMSQIILQLTERWESPEIRKSRQKVNENAKRLKQEIEEADANDREDLYDLVAVGNYFDSVGVLVMEGCLSCTIAYDLFSESVQHYHNVYKPLLQDAEHAGKFRYFIQLQEAFIKEEARRSEITPRHVV